MSGNTWNAMRGRCKEGGCVQSIFTNYIGCTMSANFKIFDFFVEWHEKQIGFGREDYDLDKDLLFPGNKLYSEETCVLIPCQLNSFLLVSTRPGDYPTGVQITPFGKYKTQMRVDGKTIHIGSYSTIAEAALSYKIAKENEAKRWYNRLLAGEFPVEPIVIEAMKNWKYPNF